MPLHREERDELAPSQLIEEHSVPYQPGPLCRISNGHRSVSGWCSELKDVWLAIFWTTTCIFWTAIRGFVLWDRNQSV
jgi:hypothetical protein